MLDTDPLLGTTIRGGTIELQSIIGDGGMGRVYKGIDLNLSRVVAVKVLHREQADLETSKVYFEREARSASKLWHPNIIQIIDFGAEPDGTLYLVMEHVPGRNLADIIEEDFPLPTERVVRILSQVLTALEVAHNQGIIHRDLKPENIMLQDVPGNPDFVKVLDFGVAKAMEADKAGPMTMAGLIMGTPHFMSPEQALGQAIDARSDIYSVGALAYQIITAELPFDGRAVMNVLAKVISERPEPPSQRRPELDIDPELELIVLRALRKKPEGRFQNAAEFREALLGVVDHERRRPTAQRPDSLPLSSEVSTSDLKPFRDRARSSVTDSIFDFVAMSRDLAINGEERRVTVLCLQIRGLNPQNNGVVADLQRLFDAEVQRVGGVSLDHVGSVSTAAFGYAAPTDSDVSSAVGAALSLLDAAASMDRTVRIGVGISHGTIMVPDGELGASFGTPLEQALDLASVADPNEILTDTKAFEVAVGVTLVPSGRPGIYVPALQGGKRPPSMLAPGFLSLPLLERQQHVAQLQQFVQTIAAGTAQSVVIAGKVGSGKSRMLSLLSLEAKTHRIAVLEVSGERFPAILPGLALSRMVRSALDLVPANTITDALASLELADDQVRLIQQQVSGFPPPEHAPFWADSLSVAIVAMLRSLAARTPLLIVCDSLESVDMLSFVVFRALAERLVDVPVGLAIAGDIDHPFVESFATHAPTITLEPLSDASVEGFVHTTFRQLSPEEQAAMVHAIAGSPLNLELMTAGAHAALATSQQPVPSDPMEVLAQRLAELPEGARKLAAIGGALGASFPLDALIGACPKSWDLRESLQIIGEAGLLAIFEDEDRVWLRFEPAAVASLALAQVVPETRKQIHGRIAQFYERTRGNNPSADHDFQWARQLLVAGFDKTAVKMFAVAADTAVRNYGSTVALPVLDALLNAAMQVFAADSKPFRSVVLKAVTFMIRAEHFEDALELLARLEMDDASAEMKAEALLLRGEALLGSEEPELARRVVMAALELTPEDLTFLRLHAHLQLGLADEALGRQHEAITQARQAMALVADLAEPVQSQHREIAWRPHLLQARVLLAQNAAERAMPLLLEALRGADGQADPVGRMRINRALALALRSTGRPRDARMAYGDALSATFVCGDVETRLRVLHDLATLQVELDDLTSAYGLFARGMQLAVCAGDADMTRYNELWLDRLDKRGVTPPGPP